MTVVIGMAVAIRMRVVIVDAAVSIMHLRIAIMVAVMRMGVAILDIRIRVVFARRLASVKGMFTRILVCASSASALLILPLTFLLAASALTLSNCCRW